MEIQYFDECENASAATCFSTQFMSQMISSPERSHRDDHMAVTYFPIPVGKDILMILRVLVSPNVVQREAGLRSL